jgi:hypothetical protein
MTTEDDKALDWG